MKQSDLAEVCHILEQAFGEPEGTQTPEGLRGRLHVVGSELAEGFFADLVVLVEGPSDKAALLATGEATGFDFTAAGIAIAVADGKTGLSKPAAIFRAFGIPTYIIWDCDLGNVDDKVEHNRALQRLVGISDANIFDHQTKVGANFAAFEVDLETTLAAEIGGALFNEKIEEARNEYGLSRRRDVCKSPVAMSSALRRAAAEGQKSATLASIIVAIENLRHDLNRRPVAAE